MKCERCGQEYPSEYYFRTATLCTDCFDPKNKKDVREAREYQIARWRSSRQRSFLGLLGFSIITLGIYFYYWLYVNIREMGEVAGRENDDVRIAGIWFWIKIGIKVFLFFLVQAVLLIAVLRDPSQFRIPYWIWIAGMANTAVNLLFFQYFLRTVAAGQNAAGITPLQIGPLFAMYGVPALIESGSSLFFAGRGLDRLMQWIETDPFEMIGGFMLLSLVSLAGSVLWLICMYMTQNQINRVWRSENLPVIPVLE